MSYRSPKWLKTMCLVMSIFLISNDILANDNSNPWAPIAERSFAQKGMDRPIVPMKYQTFHLDLPALQNLLATAPLRFSEEAELNEVVLQLPMPNGDMQRFQIFDAPIMEPELATKFPMIHSYAGVGLDDPTASLRFDVTQFGFHAFVITGRGSAIFIDPYSKSDTEHYISYYKNDYQKIGNNFTCHLHHEPNDDDVAEGPSVGPQGAGDCQLRTYKLALSCTGEYAQFHGGTKAAVMAAMNTTMTRVNGIFERDFNVNMVLVANNENLIYLDAGTDPYDDSSTTQLINESQVQCDNIIGNGNYDIGHVFSTGGGGLAGLGVVCNDNNKGRGVTGTNSPVGDPFDVDYVAHEIGHQFGANHTFNNSCGGNRSNSTAMEPGSGSTIMAYAGICAPNVQFSSDAYFHAMSIQEVSNFINNSTGNTCAVLTNTGNNNPTVSGGSDYVLPIGTPFKLSADGSDADGDTLTYCWEQMDNEIATMPPATVNTDGPAFRSYAPTGDSYRYFPKLSDVVNGVSDQWEVLPTVSRNMNFRVTARDNHAGSGCTAEDDVSLTFSDAAGPFVVQAPNVSLTWFAGTAETVTWDVAKTDQAPVSCANVDIMISFDGGFTYPTTLASGVPNDGSHSILVPNQASTSCRVMVVCSDNIFYDISNSNFTIDNTSSPTFSMLATPDVQDVCGSVGTTGFELNLNAIAGFNESVTLTTQGVPSGASSSFSQNNFVPTSTTVLNVGDLANVVNGTYEIKVIATSPSITVEQMVTLIINNSTPDAVTLNSPALGATDQDVDVALDWMNDASATGYYVEIATAPTFGNDIIETASINNNMFTPQNLQPLTVYYWRVKASNNCGDSDVPSWFSFQTKGEGCNTYNSTDIPVEIPVSGTPLVNSTIQINDQLTIADVNISANISHSWTGDLKATLTNPAGTSITLFDRPGVPTSDYGCQDDNIMVTLDDEADNSSEDLENLCNSGVAYAIEGTFQPVDALSVFNNGTSNGEWKLEIQDFENNDGGSINNWSLEVCYNLTAGTADLLNNMLTVIPSGTENVSSNYLQASSNTNASSELTFVILSLPQHGNLAISGGDVVIGTTFTQADIDNNLFTYTHDGTMTTADAFHFDVISSDGAWIPNQTFNITIATAQLTATVVIEQSISCFGGEDGIVVANAFGGTPPYTYSLNGDPFQSDNTFGNLAFGDYEVEVKDAMGNIITTNEVLLENPTALTLDVSVDIATITVNASGGTGNLNYSLNNGASQTHNVFDSLAAGVYTVIVTDEKGCTISEDNIQVAAAPLTASAEIEQGVSCFDGDDGMIYANTFGGISPLSYSLNGGAFQSDPMFDGLTPGTYSITVKDADDNTIVTNEVNLINPEELTMDVQVNGNTITITASGGTGALQYSLNNGTSQTSNIFENVAPGSYNVITSDENFCSVIQINIDIAAQPITLSSVIEKEVSCHDEADGIIYAIGAGGYPPLTYSINGSAYQENPAFDNLAAGTYSISVKDDQGTVVNADDIVLENPSIISADANVTDNIITVTASGGTGTLQYALSDSTNQTSNVFDNLLAGTYTLTVTDENGCTKVIENIQVTTVPMTISSFVEVEVSCHNGNDGMIFAVATGGTPPLQYSLNGGAYQDNPTFENLSTGTYVISVKDSYDNIITAEEVVLENPEVLSLDVTVVNNIITANATGGTGTLTYILNDTLTQDTNVFDDVPNGFHTITVTDEKGCIIFQDNIEVTYVPMSASAIVEKEIFCHDDQDGIILVSAFGGNPPLQYSLNGGDFQDSPVFPNLDGGIYNVTVMDAIGDMITTNQLEIINPNELLAFSSVIGNDVTIDASGGTGTLLYSLNGSAFQNSNIFMNLMNGTHFFTVKDENDCIAEVQVTINVIQSATVVVTNPLCFGDDNGSINVSGVTGGQMPYLYSLDNINFSSSHDFILGAGTYSIFIMDATGAVFSAGNYTISDGPTISVTALADGNTITANGLGGTGMLMYSIDGVNFQESNIFEGLDNGIYMVTVMDENECMATSIELTIDITSIFDLDFDINFELYPNPNQGLFTIELNQPTEKNLRLQIFDVAGKLIREVKFEKTQDYMKELIDVSQIAAGSYELLLTDGVLYGQKRFVKK